MMDEAKREGLQLNGHMAVAMADSPAYLKDLAQKAIDQ
jgi:hypothetical protein